MGFFKAGMFPDMGKMQDALNEKFDRLYAVLLEIRDELRLQRPPQPPQTP